MGLMKQVLIEEAEREHRRNVCDWLEERLGRKATKREIDQAEDDYELDQAFEHAVGKDD